MQPARPNQRKGIKFLDIKIFIAALSVATTVGMWNLVSNNAIQTEKTVPAAVLTLPPQPPSGAAQDLPPLPTLAPLISVSAPQAGVSTANYEQPAGLSAPLRSVAVPTPEIVQKYNPVIVEPVTASVSGGGGGGGNHNNGGGSSVQPVTTTRSSH